MLAREHTLRMSLANATTHRWTIESFERLLELGVFTEDSRVELIEGEIIAMPPMLTPHASAVTRSTKVFVRLFGESHDVRVQLPFNIPDYSQPEPDLALTPVVEGEIPHPTSADLIVEVADSTLAYDRTEKASLYARAGVRDYWIINVISSRLEVYRDPIADPSQPFGHGFGSCTTYLLESEVAPLFAPDRPVAVKSLF